ncbi:MAG: NAD(P)/FAD-dependent oxidoreductase [Chloroflexota bacterium]|nr:NAD(P)/FAD-dependent oxidoreductase [Chloroflexota bacterium]
MSRKLEEPIKIKNMELKNRIAFAPFLNMPSGEEGTITETTIRWFAERAKGETGFIMTGTINPSRSVYDMLAPLAAMSPLGMGPTLHDDKYIPGYVQLAEAMHAYGTKIGIQIALPGPMAMMGPSPSPFPTPDNPKMDLIEALMGGMSMGAREVSVEELEQWGDDLAATAARAKSAGIDCVELHCAHGSATLCCAFISPFCNRRTDKYGGDWESRLRFPLEALQKMRKAVGEDYPIMVRISADELLGDLGITLKDTTEIIVPALEKAGADCIDVSMGSMTYSPEGILTPLYYPEGCFIHLAEAVKKVTKLPVIGVGRILSMDVAEKYLQEGKADIIYLGRQLTSDPETPKKYFDGRPEDIRKCIGCLYGIGSCGRPCAINYDIQDEPIPLTPAEKAKKVLVIGGGVAGMEAATVAAQRGHSVTLMEKEAELGGIVAALARAPIEAEFGNLVNYLATQLKKQKVDVRICKEATVNDITELNPDVVILATGSTMTIPEVSAGKPGIMNHVDALRRKEEIGQKVLVQGLGYGCELALSLAEEGKDVTLFGKGTDLAMPLPMVRRIYVQRKLTDMNFVKELPRQKKVDNPKVLKEVTVDEVTPREVIVVDKEGAKTALPYDTLIVSLGRKSNISLVEALQGKVSELHQIGDCARVEDIHGAIWTANEVARKI